MKICFITENIFKIGGVQRVVSVLANALLNEHSVEILTLGKDNDENRKLYNLSSDIILKNSSDILKKNSYIDLIYKIARRINRETGILNHKFSINYLKNLYYPKRDMKYIIDYINRNDYDAVIGLEGKYILMLSIISQSINARTIGWQHNSYYAYLNTPNKYLWNQSVLFNNYIKKLDNYVVLTDSDKNDIKEKIGIDAVRIYNPLSFETKEKSRCDNKRIISVGRLDEKQKGFDMLIKAFERVSYKNSKWKLDIVGDGPDKDKLNKLIKNLKLDNKVTIHPFTENIHKYYLKSDIFISSSRWEGFGLVITEAMECGVPVIAFANSGPKEIIGENNKYGILVECENIERLSEAMNKLMNDDNIRKTFSNKSVKRANSFRISNIITQWNTIIKN